MVTRFLAKRINKSGVIEGIIVILVLSIISAVMFPLFMKSQVIAKIKHNEEELQRFIKNIQNPNHAMTDELVDHFIHTNSYFLHRKEFTQDEFREKYPQYSFQFSENQSIAIEYLIDKKGRDGYRINDELYQEAYPIFAFIFTDPNGEVDNPWMITNHPSAIFIQINKESKRYFYEPKSWWLYSITNGINSNGIFYVDYNGKNWRDRQES